MAELDVCSCKTCGEKFVKRTKAHKFCSVSCKGKWKYITENVTTDSQYKLISGNWVRYLSRLLYFGGRKRDLLNRDILLRKLEEQDYRCALSGLPLTCQLERGVNFPYNASVDRIIAGGPYSEDNIQLVCKCLNYWRADTSVEDFVEVCRAVAEYNTGKQNAIKREL